jgi:hypothetical protein
LIASMMWGGQVRIPDAHVDEVDAAGARLALVLVDLGEQVRGQLGETAGQRDRRRRWAHAWFS